MGVTKESRAGGPLVLGELILPTASTVEGVPVGPVSGHANQCVGDRGVNFFFFQV